MNDDIKARIDNAEQAGFGRCRLFTVSDMLVCPMVGVHIPLGEQNIPFIIADKDDLVFQQDTSEFHEWDGNGEPWFLVHKTDEGFDIMGKDGHSRAAQSEDRKLRVTYIPDSEASVDEPDEKDERYKRLLLDMAREGRPRPGGELGESLEKFTTGPEEPDEEPDEEDEEKSYASNEDDAIADESEYKTIVNDDGTKDFLCGCGYKLMDHGKWDDKVVCPKCARWVCPECSKRNKHVCEG